MLYEVITNRCLTHSLWHDLSTRISDFLSEITLAELVQQAEVKRIAEQQDKSKQGVQATTSRPEQESVDFRVRL